MRRHEDEAARLLALSKIIATSSSTTVSDAFPAIDAVFRRSGFSLEGQWDLFVTVAGLAMGLATYSERHPPSEVRAFASELLREAGLWDHQTAPAIVNFQQVMNRNVSEGVDAASSIGLRVVWNLLGSAPGDSAVAASPARGSFVINTLREWDNPNA